jgi:hypothetical protein
MRHILSAILLLLAACGEPSSSPADPSALKATLAGAPAKAALISKGKRYSPRDYLFPGYVTILDFYADW